jgi:hypothetical protein
MEPVFRRLAGWSLPSLSTKVELVFLLSGMKAILCLPFVMASPFPELRLLFVLKDLRLRLLLGVLTNFPLVLIKF